MVKNGFGLRGVSLHTGCALMACGMAAVPGAAQQTASPAVAAPAPIRESRVSILEQMQDEVALIASQARSGIVTIEDARAVVVNYTASPLRKADLQEQIKRLESERLNAQELVRINQARYSAGLLTKFELDKITHSLAKIEAQMKALNHALEEKEPNDPLTERKQELDDLIAELEIDHNFYTEQEKMLQQQVNAGLAKQEELIEAKERLAHAMQNLRDAQRQKNEQFRNDAAAQLENQARMYALLGKTGAPKSGSGFSIGDGYILTTADVVQGMSNPIITTDDGRRARVTLVAVDGELNIGLLRLPSELTIPALKLGDSARVAPGHFAISIGNQAGQMNSVSLSLISGTRTQGIASSRHFYPDLLQIDGAMGGGISGAPVLSARGEVIGMWAAALNNEATASTTTGFLYSLIKARQDDDMLANPFTSTVTAVPSPTSLTGTAPPVPNAPDRQPPPVSQNNTAKSTPTPPAKKPSPDVQRDDKNIHSENNSRHYYQLNGQKDDKNVQVYDLRTQYYPLSGQKMSGLSPVPRVSQGRASQTGGTGAAGSQNNWPVFFGTPANSALSASSGFAIPVNSFKGLIDRLKTGKNVVHVWLGMDLEDVDNAHEANGFVRLDRQVKVRGVYADSPAAKSGGIRSGDILVSLSDTPVHTANEVRAAVLLRFTSGQKIEVNVRRSGKSMSVPLILETRPTTTPAMLSVTAPHGGDIVRPKDQPK